MGTATGIAFDTIGNLFVGDRSGIGVRFRMRSAPRRRKQRPLPWLLLQPLQTTFALRYRLLSRGRITATSASDQLAIL